MKTKTRRGGKGISLLRTRMQKSGAKYYYVEIPSGSERKELALGKDFCTALKRREEVILKARVDSRKEPSQLLFVIKLYKEITLPTIDPKVQKVNTIAATKLAEFFQTSKFTLMEIESPHLAQEYAGWRNTKSAIRLHNEISLLKRLRSLAQKWGIEELSPDL